MAIADDLRQATGDRLRALDLLGRYAGLLQPTLAEEEDAVQYPWGRGQVLTVSAEILHDERKLTALMRALPGPPESVVLLPAQDQGLESKPVAEILRRGFNGAPTTAPAPPEPAVEPLPRAQPPARRRRRIVVAESDLPSTRNPRPPRPPRRRPRVADDELDGWELPGPL